METEKFIEETPKLELFVIDDTGRLNIAWTYGFTSEQQIKYPLEQLSFQQIFDAPDIDIDQYRENLNRNLKYATEFIIHDVLLRLKTIDEKIPIIYAIQEKIKHCKYYLEKQVISKHSLEALPSKVLNVFLSDFNEKLYSIVYEHTNKEIDIWKQTFTEQIHYIKFKKFLSATEVTLSSISFIYNKMLNSGIIYNVSHKDFLNWLTVNKLITKTLYDNIPQLLSSAKTNKISKYTRIYSEIFK